MRFWDASAVAPIVVDETSSSYLEAALRADDSIVVWWSTRVECASAIRRREREGSLTGSEVRKAFVVLDALAEGWAEVEPAPRLRVAAERALAVHSLRAADALQLAAALAWRSGQLPGLEFVCLDERLRVAAAREGFAVLPDDEDYAGMAPR